MSVFCAILLTGIVHAQNNKKPVTVADAVKQNLVKELLPYQSVIEEFIRRTGTKQAEIDTVIVDIEQKLRKGYKWNFLGVNNAQLAGGEVMLYNMNIIQGKVGTIENALTTARGLIQFYMNMPAQDLCKLPLANIQEKITFLELEKKRIISEIAQIQTILGQSATITTISAEQKAQLQQGIQDIEELKKQVQAFDVSAIRKKIENSLGCELKGEPDTGTLEKVIYVAPPPFGTQVTSMSPEFKDSWKNPASLIFKIGEIQDKVPRVDFAVYDPTTKELLLKTPDGKIIQRIPFADYSTLTTGKVAFIVIIDNGEIYAYNQGESHKLLGKIKEEKYKSPQPSAREPEPKNQFGNPFEDTPRQDASKQFPPAPGSFDDWRPEQKPKQGNNKPPENVSEELIKRIELLRSNLPSDLQEKFTKELEKTNP